LLFATPMKNGTIGGAVLSTETGKLESEIARTAYVRREPEHLVLDAGQSLSRIPGFAEWRCKPVVPACVWERTSESSSRILRRERSGPAHFQQTENISRSPMARAKAMQCYLRSSTPRNDRLPNVRHQSAPLLPVTCVSCLIPA
jgi:hypothetical protein